MCYAVAARDDEIVNFVDSLAFVSRYHVEQSMVEKRSRIVAIVVVKCSCGSQTLKLFSSDAFNSVVACCLAKSSRP